LALLQKSCTAANSGRKLARIISVCVDEILFANLKIETAIAAAHAGCQENIAPLGSFTEALDIKRGLEGRLALIQIGVNQSSNLVSIHAHFKSTRLTVPSNIESLLLAYHFAISSAVLVPGGGGTHLHPNAGVDRNVNAIKAYRKERIRTVVFAP